MKTCSNCRHWKRINNSASGYCTAPIPLWALPNVSAFAASTFEDTAAETCEAFSATWVEDTSDCGDCDTCGGTGTLNEEDCPDCDGFGYIDWSKD